MITTIVDQLRVWLIEMLVVYVFMVIASMAGVAFLVVYLPILAKFHGLKRVTCPQDGGRALIQVAAFRSAVGRVHGDSTLRVSRCSRWPARSGCAQNCAAQLTRRQPPAVPKIAERLIS